MNGRCFQSDQSKVSVTSHLVGAMLRISRLSPLALVALFHYSSALPTLISRATESSESLLSQYNLSFDPSAPAGTYVVVPSSSNDTSAVVQDGATLGANVVAPPPGLSNEFQFNDAVRIDTSQAENLIVGFMVDIAQKRPQDDVVDASYTTARSPDVSISVEPERGQHFKNVHLLWVLHDLLAEMAARKGSQFVAAADHVDLNDVHIASVGLLPSRRPGSVAISQGTNKPSTASQPDGGDDVITTSRSIKRADDDTTNLPSSNQTSTQSLGRGLSIDTFFVSTVALNEQNLYRMYANAIVALFDIPNWNPRQTVDISNPTLGIKFTLLPNPRQTGPPRLARGDAIRTVGGIATYTQERRRYTEVQGNAVYNGKLLGTLTFRRR